MKPQGSVAIARIAYEYDETSLRIYGAQEPVQLRDPELFREESSCRSRPAFLSQALLAIVDALQGEAGGLGRDADVGRYARGRAFVHVGRPLMEGYGGNLEEQAGGDG